MERRIGLLVLAPSTTHLSVSHQITPHWVGKPQLAQWKAALRRGLLEEDRLWIFSILRFAHSVISCRLNRSRTVLVILSLWGKFLVAARNCGLCVELRKQSDWRSYTTKVLTLVLWNVPNKPRSSPPGAQTMLVSKVGDESRIVPAFPYPMAHHKMDPSQPVWPGGPNAKGQLGWW